MLLGAHIGISGGIEHSPSAARSIGCETMQIFSKNQRQWMTSELSPEVARAFRDSVTREGIKSVAIHCSYLINLGSSDEDLKRKSRDALVDELNRAEKLGVPFIILHPGSHKGAGTDTGISMVSEGAKWALERTDGMKVRLLFETAAGAGNTIGRSFEELREIDERVAMRDRLGFCLDTCHIFVSGMDFRTENGYSTMMEHLESTVGISRVFFFHLNDAMFGPDSHKDRHANIGKGLIGEEGFRRLMRDKRLARMPGILETPLTEDKENPYSAYEIDLAKLRSMA
jgi:deoxyribonuclease-4